MSSIAAHASAAPQATLVGAHADYSGVQQSAGPLAGLSLRSPEALPATFTLEGSDVALHTVNLTTQQAAQVGVQPDRGGTDRSWPHVSIRSDEARADLDFLVLPLDGQPAPTLALASRSLGVERSDREELAETAYVDSTRPVLRGDVRAAALALSAVADEVVVTGAFALSVWSWDFTADDGTSNESFPTGMRRSAIVRDPLTGQAVASTDFDQVAQLRVANGTLRLRGLAGVSVAAYAPGLGVDSIGRFTLSEAVGLLDAAGAGQLGGRDLAADGTLSSHAGSEEEGVRVELRSFEGTMAVAGSPVSLGSSGPLRQAGASGGGLSAPVASWGLGIGASLGLLALALLIVKGPARRAGFNRIQARFDAKDYRGVLERIEPFTGLRRYRRRAAVLKAVSLLSLEDYKEAALYLETLDPTHGPDSATTAFLQACAAAGLEQDDVVLERLSECFRIDPSYRREARFVPMLAGYLPHFSISPEFA